MSDVNVNADNKRAATYIASEIWDANIGFLVLHQMLHDMLDMDVVNDETATHALWVAERVKAKLAETLEHAEEAADAHRSAMTA